ncbi:MAG: alpha/beta fold hydrolase BchO, partial [Pseudomonadota bacterium]
GHSAGGAVALRLALDGLPVSHILALNPALAPFSGFAGFLFPLMARALALNPFAAPFLAGAAGRSGRVAELLETTGSRIDDEGMRLYGRLVGDARHIDGALKMMARWDLKPLLRDLPELTVPVTMALGLKDGTVPTETTKAELHRIPSVEVLEMPEHGHLMHEAEPGRFADLILAKLDPACS